MAAGRLDLCGHDILGHSVNDLLACGAMPLFFLFGLGTAWLYRRSGGLAGPIAFHAFNNGLSTFAIIAATRVLDQAS